MYVQPNFKTKKALKEAVKAGKLVTVYQPNDMIGAQTSQGEFSIEGPHGYHRWYARVTVKDSRVIKVT